MTTATPDAPAPALTDTERAAMLASVEGIIQSVAGKAVRCAGGTAEDVDDAMQDCRLEVWKLTMKFDPARGVKFSTYAHAAITRHVAYLVQQFRQRQCDMSPEDWDGLKAGGRTLVQPEEIEPEDETGTDALFNAVNRQLLAAFLDGLTPGYRRFAELVGIEGLTCEQVALQLDLPLKSVRANCKLLIRALAAKGLIGHVATAEQVRAVTAPADGGWNQRRRDQSATAAVRQRLADMMQQVDFASRWERTDDETQALLELIMHDGLTVHGAADLLGVTTLKMSNRLTSAVNRMAA
jgi:RNA polymerase sigma factor (sigma-70 family)